MLVGINPNIGRDEHDLRRKLDQEYIKLFIGVHNLAYRACKSNDIYSQGTRPQEWLDWAKSRDLPIPPELEKEVARLTPPETDVVVDTRDKQIADLKAKFAEQGKELAALRSAAGQALGARERDSMAKLIIGMAVAGYKYDPKAMRGASVKEIVGDLEKLGLSLSDDTVRKFLREGADLLPPQQSGGR